MRPACLPSSEGASFVVKRFATKQQPPRSEPRLCGDRKGRASEVLFGLGVACAAQRCIAKRAGPELWRKSQVSKCRTRHVVVHEGKMQPLYDRSFDEVLPFHAPGLAPVRDGNEWWHIQPDASRAYAQTFSRVFGFYEGRAAVEIDGRWHHIVRSGEQLYSDRFEAWLQFQEWCGNYQGGFCPVRSEDGYFHLNLEGRAAYDARWSCAGDYREGSAVVHKEGRATHVDQTGKLLHGQWFLDLDVFHWRGPGILMAGCTLTSKAIRSAKAATENRPWKEIQTAYQRRFLLVEPFYNGQARVQCHDGAWQVINEVAETLCELAAAPKPDAFGALSGELVGFWKTQTLCASVELGLFESLPATVESLAAAVQVRPDRLQRLLRALAELGVVKLERGSWRPTEMGQLLREGLTWVDCVTSVLDLQSLCKCIFCREPVIFCVTKHPWTLADAAREYGRELGDFWSDLPGRLRGEDRSPKVFQEVAASPDRCRSHHRMLRSYARHDYSEVPKLLKLDPGSVVLDVGAGSGTLGKLMLEEHPKAKICLLDLPEVLARAACLSLILAGKVEFKVVGLLMEKASAANQPRG
eukprot:Skav229704  [mRNA]  locus=scaffold49:66191:71189:+ [translate_table: standard]